MDEALSTICLLPLDHQLHEGQDLVLCTSIETWAWHTAGTQQMFVAFILTDTCMALSYMPGAVQCI